MKWILLMIFATGLTYCKERKNAGSDEMISEGNVELVEAVLNVKGMTCGSCEFHVDKVVKKVDGVSYCKADSEKGVAVIKYDPEKAEIKDIITSITDLGYTANVQ